LDYDVLEYNFLVYLVSSCRAIWNLWTGLPTGLEYWIGLNCCKKPPWYDSL